MKKSFIALAIMTTAALLAGCSRQSQEAPADKSAGPESRVKPGTNGEVIVTLDAATQKVMGLQVTSLVAKELIPEVKGFGRVVDPAPLGDLLMELGRAELTYDSTHRELERMKVLRKDNNASERAFETTESQYRLDGAALGAILLKIQRTWGSKMADLTGPMVVPVGTQRKPDALLSALVDARNTFLVRVDLPAGEVWQEQPASARLVGIADEASPVDAQFFDFAPTVDSQTQTRGLFFLLTGRHTGLIPGVAVTAFIKTDQQAESGVLVPRNAVVRFNGATWIYLQTGEETFQRVAVTLDRPLADGWFVREGLKPESKIVSVGAQIILSTEMSAAGFSDGEHH